MENPVIQTLLNHRTVRKYTKQKPTDETIQTIVRAGQQAPFASQLYSVLLTRKKAPFAAPLWWKSSFFCRRAHSSILWPISKRWPTR